MKFSDEFDIHRTENDDWFDPVLSIDTKLFIDPFLIYEIPHPAFSGAHQDVITFFNSVFGMIAQSQGHQSSLQWQQAVSLLEFPEVEEICLGYTNADTAGSGSGIVLARAIAASLWEAVRAGIREIRHFEEVLLLREGIGADRISDITASLLRVRLSEYTRSIAERHRLPLNATHYRRGIYLPEENRWSSYHTQLPLNPYNRRPILLVPATFLRSLPTIDAYDFWEYSYSNENETLRREYSQDVSRRVDKETIVSFARRHPEIRSRYIVSKESSRSEPYDYREDPQGLIKWYDASASFCVAHPLHLAFQSSDEFKVAIDQMIDEYKLFVEDNEGWRLLWNENRTPKREEAAQLLLLGIVKHYCRANNIDVTREADIGRGPVDFKASQGYELRALIEVKLAKNSKFWNGLEKQLPTYLRAESINLGYFLVIVQSEEDNKRLQGIQSRVDTVRRLTGCKIQTVIVDARSNPPSASRL